MIDDMQARLRAKIAEQDEARGRSLTDRERLDNLSVALTKERVRVQLLAWERLKRRLLGEWPP